MGNVKDFWNELDEEEQADPDVPLATFSTKGKYQPTLKGNNAPSHLETMPTMEAAAIGNKLVPEDRMAAARALYPDADIAEHGDGGITVKKRDGTIHTIDTPSVAPWNPDTFTKQNVSQLAEPILSRGATALAGAAMGAQTGTPHGVAAGTLAGLFAGPSVQNLLASTEAGGSTADHNTLIDEGAADVVLGTAIPAGAKWMKSTLAGALSPAARRASSALKAYKQMGTTQQGAAEVTRNIDRGVAAGVPETELPAGAVLADASTKAPSKIRQIFQKNPHLQDAEFKGGQAIKEGAENVRQKHVQPEIEASLKNESVESATGAAENTRRSEQRVVDADISSTKKVKDARVAHNENEQQNVREWQTEDYARKIRNAETQEAHNKQLESLEQGDVRSMERANEIKSNRTNKYNKEVRSVNVNNNMESRQKLARPQRPDTQPTPVAQGRPAKPVAEPGTHSPPKTPFEAPETPEVDIERRASLIAKQNVERVKESNSTLNSILEGKKDDAAIRIAQAKQSGNSRAVQSLRSRIAQDATPGEFTQQHIDALNADGSEEAKQLLEIDSYVRKMGRNAQSVKPGKEDLSIEKVLKAGARGIVGAGTLGVSEAAHWAHGVLTNKKALQKALDNPQTRQELYKLIREGLPISKPKVSAAGAVGGAEGED